MDVARIEPITLKKLDWQRMTAKEILRCEEQGIEVPSVYLSWAKNFISEVTSGDNDSVTYETASTGKVSTREDESRTETSKSSENPVAEGANADTNGVFSSGYFNEDEVLRRIDLTNAAANSASEAGVGSEATSPVSDDEIEALDRDMNDIISKAEGIASRISGGDKDKSLYGNLSGLMHQLQMYGIVAQTELAQSEGFLNSLGGVLSEDESVILNAADLGNDAIAAWNEMWDNIRQNINPYSNRYFELMSRVRTAGENALDKSDEAKSKNEEATRINNENKSVVSDYKNLVSSVTHVSAAASISGEENEDGSKENASNTDREKNSGDVKSDKNDTKDMSKTDPANAASASLDTVLLAKIRRGEIPSE